jgi:hypothetical protein
MRNFAVNVLCIIGLLLFIAGVAMISLPLGVMSAGIVLVSLAVLIDRAVTPASRLDQVGVRPADDRFETAEE